MNNLSLSLLSHFKLIEVVSVNIIEVILGGSKLLPVFP